MSSQRTPSDKSATHRWHWLFMVVIVVAIIGIYCGLSVLGWREVDVMSARAEAASNRSLAALQAGNLTPQKLNEISEEVERIAKESCSPGILAYWQSAVVAQYHTKATGCLQNKDRLSKQVRVIQEIAKYVNSERFIAKLLHDASVKLNTIPAQEYTTRQKVWQKVVESLQGSDMANKKLKTVVIERVKAIVAALTALDAANKAMDVQRFDVARQDLQRAYGALTGIQNVSVEQFQSQVDALIKVYL
ncbi:MAG: hypothetical protein Q4B06_03290 [Candidatus Saccharibacteria bacterium]|nr:hypothetical protein [Candidatus Saccharibacteria bacterium]